MDGIMQIKFVPIFSGSSGNCALFATEGAKLLIDAGKPGSAIIDQLKRLKLDPSSLDGILVTHEHTDHSKGVGVLSRRFDLPVYATAATFSAMERSIGSIASKNLRVIHAGREFSVGNVCVFPISIPHDAADPVGFVIRCCGRTVAQFTDLGHMPKEILNTAAEADLVVLESNHDVCMLKNGPYPARLKNRILGRRGHLSNDTAAESAVALARRGVTTIVLGHLSAQNNTETVAYETVCNALCKEGLRLGEDLRLEVASREGPTIAFDLSV
jgi:phosphoribosyl 1,2-cyclic phosphodiesterase